MQEIFLRWKIDGISNMNRDPEFQDRFKKEASHWNVYRVRSGGFSLSSPARFPGRDLFSRCIVQPEGLHDTTTAFIKDFKIGLCNNGLNPGDAKEAIENDGTGVTGRAHKPNGLLNPFTCTSISVR